MASPHSRQDRVLALNTDRAAAAGIRPTIGAVGVSTAVSEMPNRQQRSVALRRSRVGPRHRGISSGGNETHFRPAGGLKNIVYENRGVFDKFIIL